MPPSKAPPPSKSPARRPATKGRAPRTLAPASGRALPLGGRGQGIVGLFRELKSEIRKVSWPTPRQAANMTGVIVALSAALGAFLGLVDFSFQELFRLVLQGIGAAGFGGGA
ncbi:MAG: preprotein translocase subunit SecE [Chloroflexota bacterium]